MRGRAASLAPSTPEVQDRRQEDATMDDLEGTAAERLDRLERLADADGVTPEWTRRQLERALRDWALDQDTLAVLGEGREDY
jgi:hypothetical protein